MTNKEKAIHHLHQARVSHIRWVNTIKLLVSGIDVPDGVIALNPMESEFGKWYYQEASLFSDSISKIVLEEIESLFLTLHDKYMKIYPIYYKTKKKGLIGTILGHKSGINEYETEFSQRYYEDIVSLSDKLKQKMRVLETQMMSYAEEKFDAVIPYTGFDSPKQPVPELNETETDAYYYGTRGRN